MKINSNKGITLIELLVALLIMAMLGTLLTSLLMFGTDIFRVYSNFTRQQDHIVDSVQKLKKDIEQSSKITIYKQTDGTVYTGFIKVCFPDTYTSKIWKFDNGMLKLGVMSDDPASPSQPTTFLESVERLQTTACKFEYSSTDKRLTVFIQPEPNNTGRFGGKNINKQIITDFSVQYKKVEEKIFTILY